MKVLVVGRAKTGTTIVSRRIQSSMPGAAFVMEPDSLAAFVAPYESDLVVKTIFEHWKDKRNARMALFNNELAVTFDRKVFVIRDPRDEFISRLLYLAYDFSKRRLLTRSALKPWIDVIKEKERHPESVSVNELLAVVNTVFDLDIDYRLPDTQRYFKFIRSRVSGDDTLLLRYEEFVTGVTQALESFLGFPLATGEIKERRLQRVNRTAAANNWKSFFLPEDLAEFKRVNQRMMKRVGYTDWELEPQLALEPAHYSLFLERLIDDAEAMANAMGPK